MTLKEFFNSEFVSLPKGGYNEAIETFDDFLEDRLKAYVDHLLSVRDPKWPEIEEAIPALAQTAWDLTSSILRAVRLYLAGHVHSAYEELRGGLTKIRWEYFRAELIESDKTLDLLDPLSQYWLDMRHPVLYRLRCERSEFSTPRRGDLFHVPFEKRRLVGNQRYSIAGLPCLYLGSSIWICWEELGRPPLDSVWVSRFRVVRPISVLDFHYPPHHFWRFNEISREEILQESNRGSQEKVAQHFSPEYLKAYLTGWPMIAACSIKRSSKVGVFVPEYIVPQLLLQWVNQEQQVDGIRYFSARMPSSGPHFLAHANYVFPVKTSAVDGYCSELKKDFAFTAPLSWEALTAIRLQGREPLTREVPNGFSFIQMNDELQLPYSQTAFFEVEQQLKFLEVEKGLSKALEP